MLKCSLIQSVHDTTNGKKERFFEVADSMIIRCDVCGRLIKWENTEPNTGHSYTKQSVQHNIGIVYDFVATVSTVFYILQFSRFHSVQLSNYFLRIQITDKRTDAVTDNGMHRPAATRNVYAVHKMSIA